MGNCCKSPCCEEEDDYFVVCGPSSSWLKTPERGNSSVCLSHFSIGEWPEFSDHILAKGGEPEFERPSNVTLVQEKNSLAGKDGEGETTSKAENKCQPKTELEKSTSEMQNEENQETVKVVQDNLDTQKDIENNFDATQKGESLEKPCSNEQPVQTEVKENSSSEETVEVDVANVIAKPEVDDGAEKMNQEDFEGKSEGEESDLSVETNIVGESAFDNGIEDQPPVPGLASNGAEKMSELNEEDFEEQSQVQIPFEKSYSSAGTNIVGDGAADIQVEDEPQKTELASANVHSCSRNAEFENKDVLIDGEIVGTITEVESQDEVEDKISVDEDIRIEENVGGTTFEMTASAANSSGEDNNEVDKELGEASSCQENVVKEQEFEEDASEVISSEEEDSSEDEDSISEGEIKLEGRAERDNASLSEGEVYEGESEKENPK